MNIGRNKKETEMSSGCNSGIITMASTFFHTRNDTEFSGLDEKTPLYQRKIDCTAELAGCLPEEIWESILQNCDIVTVIILRSVAKFLLIQINKMKEIGIAKQIFLEKGTLNNIALCKFMGQLNFKENEKLNTVVQQRALPINDFINNSKGVNLKQIQEKLNSKIDCIKWQFIICGIIALAVPTGIFSILWKLCELNADQLKLSALILYPLCFLISSLCFLLIRFCYIDSRDTIV